MTNPVDDDDKLTSLLLLAPCFWDDDNAHDDDEYDGEDNDDGEDLIATAGSTSSGPLEVLSGPGKGSPKLHDLPHLFMIKVRPMIMVILVNI